MSSNGKRILIDGRMLLGRFSGVARVVTKLVEHLATRPDIHPVVLCGDEPYLPWAGRDDIEMLITDFRRRDRSAVRRLIWEEMKLAGWVSRSGADVYHATWNSGVPAGASAPSVLTIHDLIPWEQRDGGVRQRVGRWCYRRSVSSSAGRADVVTAVSDFSRGEICRKLGIAQSGVLTVHNGVSPPCASSDVKLNGDTGANYVLYVGGHERRKNLAGVLRAVRSYWRCHDAMLELRLTGTRDALCPEAREQFESLPSGSPIEFLGAPSDGELGSLYRNARALLMLSTNEGFGLPVLEAMAHGCPVVAANCASLPEVVGDAGVLVEPDDADGTSNSLRRVIRDTEHREQLIVAGFERVQRFTWGQACDQMVAAYETASSKYARSVSGGVAMSLATHSPA